MICTLQIIYTQEVQLIFKRKFICAALKLVNNVIINAKTTSAVE